MTNLNRYTNQEAQNRLASLGLGGVNSAGYKKLVDEASATITYVGTAAQDTGTDEAGWLIQKVDTTSGVAVTWASNSAFDQIWDNRASLSYS